MSGNKYLVVATRAELDLPWAECERDAREVIVTGAYIAAMGFGKIRSIKFVSDNLSIKQYNEMTNGHA